MIAKGDIDGGLQIFMDALEGPGAWKRLPATPKQLLRDNATTLIGQIRDQRPPFSKADAEAIRTPTLFIGGANTKGTLPKVLHALAANVKGSRTAMIPGTTHPMFEQETTFLPALEMLPGLTPELLAENRSWMQEAGALDDKDVLILCFQSYVVKTPHHTILIDSCIGNDKPRPQRPKWNMKTDDIYARALAAAGISVGDIDYVMCTHLHVDHVGWNTRLDNGRWVPTFPKARYVFDKTEFDYWTETHAKTPVPPFADSVLPVVEARQAEIVRSDYQIGDHTRILPTPGHTPGHVAFTFGRGKDDAVFSGDLMHSPLQTRYPEMSVKFDVDQAQAATTRRNFMERYCDTDTLCCTAHFPSPSVGKIRRKGNGFSCEAI